MGKRKYTVVFFDGRKEDIVLEETQPVLEIRAILQAAVDNPLEPTKELMLMCQGKQIRNEMGTWEEAMTFLFPQRFVSADQEEQHRATHSGDEGVTKENASRTPPPCCDSFLLKIYCSVGERDVSSEISLEAMRDILPQNERSSREEREILRQFLEPHLDSIVSNSDFMKKMLEQEGINVNNPAIKQMINDKDAMKMALSSSYDRDAQRRLAQSNLQIAQYQANPDAGFVINSMMENASKDIMDGDGFSNLMAKKKENDNEEEDDMGDGEDNAYSASHPGGTGNPLRHRQVQKNAMPNPWQKPKVPPTPATRGGGYPGGFAPFSSPFSVPFRPPPSSSSSSSSPPSSFPFYPASSSAPSHAMPFSPFPIQPDPPTIHNRGENTGNFPKPLARVGAEGTGQSCPPPRSGDVYPIYFTPPASGEQRNPSLPVERKLPATTPATTSAPSSLVVPTEEKNGSVSGQVNEQEAKTTRTPIAGIDSSSFLHTAAFEENLHMLLNEFGFSDRKVCEDALIYSAGNIEDALFYLEKRQDEEEAKKENNK